MSTTSTMPAGNASATQTVPPTEAQASTTGRDAKGRFTAGNIGGPGNPFARQVAKLRSTFIHFVTPKELADIVCTLKLLALNGNLAAIKLILQYTIGKPTAPVNPDTLDIEEFKQIYLPQREITDRANKIAGTLSPNMNNFMIRTSNAIMDHQATEVLTAPLDQHDRLMRELFGRTRSPAPVVDDAADIELVGAGAPGRPSTNGENGHGGPSTNGKNGQDGPSTNGGNGRGPSTNGGNGQAKPPRRGY